MPPLGKSPDSRRAGFLKNTVTFVPSRRFSLVEPLPRSQSAMCSSSKTIVLPRGLTWANPLGSTVPTRHTWAGNAVLMCSCRALGILAKAHSPLLTGRRALTVARRLPPVNGPCYPCREHMICPLPRANEMSALQARWDRAMSNKEGAHALSRGRRGAGHETTGGHLPSLGGDADVVAGRRYFGNRPPQPATLAGALSGRRGPRAV